MQEQSTIDPANPLQQALAAANDLLISTLALGDIASTDDADLLQQIAAYRSSIQQIEHGLQQSRQQSQLQFHQQQPDSQQDRTAAHGQAPDESMPKSDTEAPVDTAASVDDLDPSEWQVPPYCIPIHANVTTFDWSKLYNKAQFDVIMMDPPWQLATANPTRGVALGYSQLTDADIYQLPVPQLQQSGFLFVWVINSKYKLTLDLFDKWGYTLVDEIVWVKMTVNRRLAKSHGYYLQHAKEVCMVARKNTSTSSNPAAAAAAESTKFCSCVGSDVIFSERRGQSQKPEEIYELIEALVPDGCYLEIFARKNNLRNFWVSVGNEVTGTGLPDEDMQALEQSSNIPGAVYGRGTGNAAKQ